MWWMAAAAAAPIVANMLTPQPSTPTYAQIAPSMSPQMANYQNQELQTAFNPNYGANQRASDTATNAVNTNMARLGLARSSMGIAAQQDAQAKVAQDWRQSAFQNQATAMGQVNSANQQQNQVNEFNAGASNQTAQAAYNAAMQQRQNTMGMWSTAASLGAKMYGMSGGNGTSGSTPGVDPNTMNNSAFGNPANTSSISPTPYADNAMGSQYQPQGYGVGYGAPPPSQYGLGMNY